MCARCVYVNVTVTVNGCCVELGLGGEMDDGALSSM